MISARASAKLALRCTAMLCSSSVMIPKRHDPRNDASTAFEGREPALRDFHARRVCTKNSDTCIDLSNGTALGQNVMVGTELPGISRSTRMKNAHAPAAHRHNTLREFVIGFSTAGEQANRLRHRVEYVAREQGMNTRHRGTAVARLAVDMNAAESRGNG